MIIFPINTSSDGGVENIKFFQKILIAIAIFAVIGFVFAVWGAFIRADGQTNAEYFINEFILR
jgi:hypothetical protein